MPKRIIIDCDVGIDDALALILAYHSPELEVEAITGVNGNVPIDRVFENIPKILSLIQPSHRPLIAKGADGPLRGKPVYARSFHGEDGLGGAGPFRKDRKEHWTNFHGPADELILEMARQYPDELTLIAIGPLTNVALGLQKDPERMRGLKEVVIMGGAVRTRGNITPFAEFNFFVDPAAAKIVLESGLPITLVPLDVTHDVFLTPWIIEEKVKPIDTPFSKFVIEATGYQPVGKHLGHRTGVFHLHDPLAVGVAIHPDLVQKERLGLRVKVEEGERYGQISEKENGPKVEVCLGVKAAQFVDLFISSLSEQ